MKNFYVVTGGPGVGKTTVLHELEKMGFKIVAEDARKIIEEQIQSGGNGLPWKDEELYSQLMLEASVESYKTAVVNSEGIVFFDRGILDAIGYARMTGLEVTGEMITMVESFRYNPRVFILPPWFEIYKTDDARKQTWEEAELTFGNLKKTYLEHGYEMIELPLDSVENRVEIILDHIDF
jgi:predicted ATPase